MATTGRVIAELLNGVRDSTGAVVASGLVRAYQPGTSTPQNIYSDDACTSAVTQPYSLDAGGRAKLFMLDPIRLVVKDSTDSTTILDTVLVTRHDAVYVTASGINGGAETTLESVLNLATTSLGSAFQYKESSTGTARSYVDVLGERCVSVLDYGATGDGSTDDTTAVQAAIDRVEARGGGIVYFPEGTFAITGVTVDAAGVSLHGCGRLSVIKNTSTSATAITVNLGSAVDCKLQIRDLAVTASSTSSGKAILVSNGNRVLVEDVSVALHRTGIDVSAVSDAKLSACLVLSTDNNAACIGMSLGTRGKAIGCELTGSTNGTGILAGYADTQIADCYISGYATGIDSDATRVIIDSCTVAANTTGIDCSSSAAHITSATVTTSTTGVSLSGAQACVSGSHIVGATTGLTTTNGASSLSVSGSFVNGATTGMLVSGTLSNVSACQILGTTALSAASTATYSTVAGCNVSGATTGITSAATYSTVSGNVIATAATTAISMTGQYSSAVGNSIVGSTTTGINVGAANIRVIGNQLTSCTTAISVGAHAGCVITDNSATSCTTDFSSSGTTAAMGNNVFSTVTDSGSHQYGGFATRVTTYTTDSSTTPSLTPVAPIGSEIYPQLFELTGPGTGNTTATINATSTSTLSKGSILWLTFRKNGTAGNLTLSFNSQYKHVDASTTFSYLDGDLVSRHVNLKFMWNGTYWVLCEMSNSF